MIQLSVIQLSGGHCIYKMNKNSNTCELIVLGILAKLDPELVEPAFFELELLSLVFPILPY